jgi:hypothetical protein
LVIHTNGQSPPAREIALIWLSQFCVYYKKRILDSLAGVLSSALPWLHDDKLKGNLYILYQIKKANKNSKL